ncbi:hypothetical protein RyT2_25070 [Pseudolactococcus yaeyamensis]
MKKTILVVLSSMLLSSSALLVNADTSVERATESGVEFTQEKIVGVPRDPKDPSKPFPGKQGTLNAYEDDTEQNYSQATKDNPKLLSSNEEIELGLTHVPAKLSFGAVVATDGLAVYRSIGDAAFYEDEIYHLQMMDNRSPESTGWSVSVQLQDKITSTDGSHKVEGAMLWIPKGESRNELNQNSASVDTTNFEAFAGYVTDAAPLEVWRTQGNDKTRGKAVSSYVLAANAMELHIPENTEFQRDSYAFDMLWTVAATPDK